VAVVVIVEEDEETSSLPEEEEADEGEGPVGRSVIAVVDKAETDECRDRIRSNWSSAREKSETW
jgi:hypothetical protein